MGYHAAALLPDPGQERHDLPWPVFSPSVPTGVPEVRPGRTNVDTGAVFGGALTAGAFGDEQDEAVAFLRVEA